MAIVDSNMIVETEEFGKWTIGCYESEEDVRLPHSAEDSDHSGGTMVKKNTFRMWRMLGSCDFMAIYERFVR